MKGGGRTALALAVLASSAGPALAFHTPFLYRVDRFEADGNTLGAFDGTPDVVDEFDTPPLGPLWYTQAGTVSESGGYLVLQSPGVHFPTSPDGSGPLDVTVVRGTSIVLDGSGDFSGTAFWEGVLPNAGDHYYLALYTRPDGAEIYAEIFSVALRGTADAIELEQVYTEYSPPIADYQNTEIHRQAIDPGDVSGRILFRISFDDATNVATSSFSLDDGTTWQSPFAGHVVFTPGSLGTRTSAEFVLVGDPPFDSGMPPTTSTTSTTLPTDCSASGCRRDTIPFKGKLIMKNDNVTGPRNKLTWKWKKGQATTLEDFGTPTLGTETYYFCVGDATGAVVTDAVATRGRWEASRTGYAYVKGEWGIYKVVLKPGVDGEALVLVKARGQFTPLPSFPAALPLTVRLGRIGGPCWAETFSSAGVRSNTDSQFKGKADGP